MKVVTYMCDNCLMMHEFPEEEKRDKYLCPDCGNEMWYYMSDEIDPETDLVINSWCDEERKKQSEHAFTPSQPIPSSPTITCPYCQSTNVSKIGTLGRMASIGFWGLASGKVGKQWHCKKCGSDF